MSADATWLVRRLYDRGDSVFDEHPDGTATLTTPYSHLGPLAEAVLQHMGRLTALEPDALVDEVEASLERVAALHDGRAHRAGRSSRRRSETLPAAPARSQGPVAPERFALLQALLAFLLERCGEEASATVASADVRERFHLTQQELEEHLDLLNLVNFGGGCYAVYCSTENGSIMVDKELYGDTFRRPARLSPLEAKALLRALDVVAPLVAAEAHTSLDTVRVEGRPARSAPYELRDTPAPSPAGGEESAVSVLNEGVRDRRVVRIGYLSRSSSEFSERVIEPYLLRRDERGWYVEAWDLHQERPADVQGRVRARRRAARSDLRAAQEMDDLSAGLDAARHRPRAVRAQPCRARARAAGRQLGDRRRRRPGAGRLRLPRLADLGAPALPRRRRAARPGAAARRRPRAALELLHAFSGARAR